MQVVYLFTLALAVIELDIVQFVPTSFSSSSTSTKVCLSVFVNNTAKGKVIIKYCGHIFINLQGLHIGRSSIGFLLAKQAVAADVLDAMCLKQFFQYG